VVYWLTISARLPNKWANKAKKYDLLALLKEILTQKIEIFKSESTLF